MPAAIQRALAPPAPAHHRQVCHNAVKRAWERTTRTFSRKQRQRRPSYRLRQSTGVAGSGSRGGELEEQEEAAAAAAAEEEAMEAAAAPPALKAAQHTRRV